VVAALLAHVLTESGGAVAGKQAVDAQATTMARGGSHALEALWRDCPDPVRGDVVRLATVDEVITDGYRREFLIENGIAMPSGRKIRLSNGLMKEFAKARGSDVTDVRRLFDGGSDGLDLGRAETTETMTRLLASEVSCPGRLRTSTIRRPRSLEQIPVLGSGSGPRVVGAMRC
jgi:hypothetical protein